MKVDRSIEFSYEELSDATNNFSMEHKIGQGGFGSVYYAELRGEVSSTFSQCETWIGNVVGAHALDSSIDN
jgi:hypothetical protein